MKYLLILLALLSTLASCNLREDRKLSEAEMAELARTHNDSVSVVLEPDNDISGILDSMRRISIHIPPLYDKTIFDSATTIKFYELAKSTHGSLKLLVNSKLISNEIINIIKANAENGADLLILMDKTGSMADDIEHVKKGLGKIINVLNTFSNVRLGIALYGDKAEDGDDWFSFKNFETAYEEANGFIDKIQVTGGGDYPESVYEGFFSACDQGFWQSDNKRMIILIGDAPPLEKPVSMHAVGDVIRKAREDKVKMNFYPIVVNPEGEIEDSTVAAPEVKAFKSEKLVSAAFPNPVRDMLNIQFRSNASYLIELFNSAGVRVSSDNFSGEVWQKDLSAFPNGPYVARIVRQDRKFETVKIIVYK